VRKNHGTKKPREQSGTERRTEREKRDDVEKGNEQRRKARKHNEKRKKEKSASSCRPI
jgi:hypothetical protein